MKKQPRKSRQHVLLITRKAGANPVTGEVMPEATEQLFILAGDADEAYRKSATRMTLPFFGQERTVHINGQLYLGNH